jgi:hypothetical protein
LCLYTLLLLLLLLFPMHDPQQECVLLLVRAISSVPLVQEDVGWLMCVLFLMCDGWGGYISR